MGFDQGFVISTEFATTSSVGGLSLATVGGEENVPTLPTPTQVITEGGEDGPPTFPSPATPVTVV